MSLLRFQNINKVYSDRPLALFKRAPVQVLHDINLTLHHKEIFGIIGESGSGKSTLGRLAVRLSQPSRGHIFFENQNITNLSKKAFQSYRKKIQIILQDPHNALNPSLSVGASIEEALTAQHTQMNAAERRERVATLLQQTGLSPAIASRRPHELSGGQKQRIGIARAIAVNPTLIVADEIVAALDVSVQAHILNLMLDLRSQFNMAYLFISHDLAIVQKISDRVAVLYKGRIVETGLSNEVFQNPLHPYTQTLLASSSATSTDTKTIFPQFGNGTTNRSSGCCFYNQCFRRKAICENKSPDTVEISPTHHIACWIV
ncbi:oligopeptide/dipeptide ABC transporter ATP-binding protein [Acetobacter syzygii]|uniref:oligopeptide/dipeptide ABC transporter ATP-binding protein n=1 Tax=Acetobacter syzygii TaxID=146476 RepID=UPI0039E95865